MYVTKRLTVTGSYLMTKLYNTRIHLAFYQKLSTTQEYGIGLEDLSQRQSKMNKKATGNLCSFNYITIFFL